MLNQIINLIGKHAVPPKGVTQFYFCPVLPFAEISKRLQPDDYAKLFLILISVLLSSSVMYLFIPVFTHAPLNSLFLTIVLLTRCEGYKNDQIQTLFCCTCQVRRGRVEEVL